MEGTICKVNSEKGYGFIATQNHQGDVFFHVKDLADGLPFNEQLQELRVRFDIVEAPRGPRAKNVQPAK